ncbi:13742_t:CDS:2 [Ambispora leptoticha]|uniref:13742_t:CDS:1 n=1 Tax=Ambispora leptoticha TaxID=144679 RepID=A0A9N9B5M0_9GLOM|nr:13742_t:CDS:2 [Ambispora leptoticha]
MLQRSSASISSKNDIISEEPSPAYTPYPSPGEQSLLFGPQRPWENTTITPQSTSFTATYYPQTTPGKPCRKCWELFVIPHVYSNNSSNNYYGYANNQYQQQSHHNHSTQPLNYSSNSGATYNNIPGNVLVVKPGDAALGGWLCTNCRGSGQAQTLMGGGFCSRCRGVGRLFQ